MRSLSGNRCRDYVITRLRKAGYDDLAGIVTSGHATNERNVFLQSRAICWERAIRNRTFISGRMHAIFMFDVGRHRRISGEQDGVPRVGDRQRRAEKLFLAALHAHGDPTRARASRDTRHRATESRERANSRSFRGKYHLVDELCLSLSL